MLPPIVAHLMGDISHFAGKMAQAESLTKGLTDSGSRNWAQMGKQAMAVGGIMAAASGAVIAESVRAASGFDTLMERVHTQAGASQADVDALKGKVLSLAGVVGQGPDALANALFHIESAFQGIKNNDAMTVLADGAKLATISGANLDDVIYGLSSVMNTYGAKANQAATYSAFFNSVVGAGDMRMQDFASSIGTGFFSTAQTFGVSLQSAGAALAFMTDRGQHADAASTHLRMSLALMAAPSLKATGILKSLGMTSHEAATQQQIAAGVLSKAGITYSSLASDLRKPDGFVVALSHLKKGLMDSGLSAEAANAQLSHAFGGGKSDATILAMLNNLGTLKAKYDAVGKGMNSFGSAWASTQQLLSTKLQQTNAAAASLAIQIGNVLLPWVQKLMGWISTGTMWLTQHAGAAKVLAGVLVGTLAVGLAILTAGFIALAVATAGVWAPILGIIVVLGLVLAAVGYWWSHWHALWGVISSYFAGVQHRFVVDVTSAWGAVEGYLSGVWGRMKADVSGVWDWIIHAVSSGGSAVYSTLSHWFQAVLNWLGWVPSWFWQVGEGMVQGIINGIIGNINAVLNAIGNVATSAVKWAKGLLGINSPSKVFAEVVGKAIPEGIAYGVDGHSDLAGASVRRLAAGLPGQMGSNALASAGAGGSGGITINLTSTATLDGKVVFTNLQRLALQYQVSNGRPAFSLPNR